jgi:surface antigen
MRLPLVCLRPAPKEQSTEAKAVGYSKVVPLGIGYLFLLVLVELVSVSSVPWYGPVLYGLVLLLFWFHAALCWKHPFCAIPLILSFVPAGQLVLLAVGRQGGLPRLLIVALPLVGAGMQGLYLAEFSWTKVRRAIRALWISLPLPLRSPDPGRVLPHIVLLGSGYLLLVALVELLVLYIVPLAAPTLYSAVLALFLLHAALCWDRSLRYLPLTLALIPSGRLILLLLAPPIPHAWFHYLVLFLPVLGVAELALRILGRPQCGIRGASEVALRSGRILRRSLVLLLSLSQDALAFLGRGAIQFVSSAVTFAHRHISLWGQATWTLLRRGTIRFVSSRFAVVRRCLRPWVAPLRAGVLLGIILLLGFLTVNPGGSMIQAWASEGRIEATVSRGVANVPRPWPGEEQSKHRLGPQETVSRGHDQEIPVVTCSGATLEGQSLQHAGGEKGFTVEDWERVLQRDIPACPPLVAPSSQVNLALQRNLAMDRQLESVVVPIPSTLVLVEQGATVSLSPIQTTFSNPYSRGQCTWYAKERRPDLPWFSGAAGNALNWATSALQYGFRVDGQPAVGAVMVFQPWDCGDYVYGHVAYVEEVGEEYLLISECNVVEYALSPDHPRWWEAGHSCGYRYIPLSGLGSSILFIHEGPGEAH